MNGVRALLLPEAAHAGPVLLPAPRPNIMQANPTHNKMVGGQIEATAAYVQRCQCGEFVEMPVSGQMVRCPACRLRHQWPVGKVREPTRRRVVCVVSRPDSSV